MRKLCFNKMYCTLLFSITILSCGTSKNSLLPEVETLNITEITQTSALSGGVILSEGSSGIVAQGVCWGTGIDPDLTDSHTLEGLGNASFESLLTGLLPGLEYNVRAYATNEEGLTYGENRSFITLPGPSTGIIIADHTVVDQYNKIPQEYIDKVKKMWLVYAGESHSAAIRAGLTMLSEADSRFRVSVLESGTPEPYTENHLRVSRATWGDYRNASGWIYSYGEEDWFMSPTAKSRTKAGITYCNTNNLLISVIGFGWCWDDELDASDINLYLSATQEYIDYCLSMGYSTKPIFTTGPVDGARYIGVELGWQNHNQHEQIRNYVKDGSNRILFDYADILCYDDGSSNPQTSSWNGNTYPVITTANYGSGNIGHIGPVGALRLAKAMWWMLARIAGWDGESR